MKVKDEPLRSRRHDIQLGHHVVVPSGIESSAKLVRGSRPASPACLRRKIESGLAKSPSDRQQRAVRAGHAAMERTTTDSPRCVGVW